MQKFNSRGEMIRAKARQSVRNTIDGNWADVNDMRSLISQELMAADRSAKFFDVYSRPVNVTAQHGYTIPNFGYVAI